MSPPVRRFYTDQADDKHSRIACIELDQQSRLTRICASPVIELKKNRRTYWIYASEFPFLKAVKGRCRYSVAGTYQIGEDQARS